MIDLHCHILPGVDDGPATLDEALAMARFCAADGITHVFATPHCHRHVHWLRAEIIPHVREFNDALAANDVAVTVLPGSEIQVINSNDYRREFETGVFCHLGDGREFTLLEFSWNKIQFPNDAAALIRWIRSQNMTPIVAHPERYSYFWTDVAPLESLVEAGAWVQITADSVLGNHGPAPQSAGREMLRRFPNAVLATDGHNMKRCSGLAAGFAWVEAEFGEARVADLKARAAEVLNGARDGHDESSA